MEKLDFCPNCGASLDSGDEFCPNCGFDLKKYVKEDEVKSTTDSKEREPVKKAEVKEAPINSNAEGAKKTISKKPKKKNKGLIAVITIVILLIVGYFVGNMYYSADHQEQRLQDEATSGNASRMKSALVNSEGKQLSDSNIGALKRLYLKDSSAIRNIESQISANQSSNIFSLKKTGKYLLVFPKYKLMVKTKTLIVNTNISNPTFLVDGKSVSSKADDGSYEISQLTPGVYDIKAENAKKNSETKTKQVEVSVNEGNVSVEFNVKKVKKAPKVITKVIHEKDSDNSDIDSDNDSNDSSDDSLVGKYIGDPDLALYSDGTYDLGDKTGTYDILENNDGHVKIKFNQDNGGSIVESYDYSDGELHSSKYDQSWYKD